MILDKNIPYYLLAIGLFFALKFGYTLADTNDLNFLLTPTNEMIELLTGYHSTYVKGEGFVYKQLHVLIDKSCSGFNFFLLSFLMLVFLLLKYVHSSRPRVLAFIFSIIGAYLLTIFVNSSRIFTSIIVQSQDIPILKLYPAIIHEAIGIITNLTFLILAYLVIEKILIKKTHNAQST